MFSEQIRSGRHGDHEGTCSFHQRGVQPEAEPWFAEGLSGGVSPGCPGVSFMAAGFDFSNLHLRRPGAELSDDPTGQTQTL